MQDSSSLLQTLTVRNWFGKKTLYANGVAQSGPEYVPMWKRCFEIMGLPDMKNCLVLGIGGGDVIKMISKQFPLCCVDGVDLDPRILEIAKTDFNIQQTSLLKFYVADASRFITQKKKAAKYDLIIVDLYIGRTNPAFCRNTPFLRHVKNRLKPGGSVLFNAHMDPKNTEDFIQFNHKVRTLFSNIQDVYQNMYNHMVWIG